MTDASRAYQPETKLKRPEGRSFLTTEQTKRLYRRHLQAAYVRSGACFFAWLFIIVGWLAGVFDKDSFIGMSVAISYLILFNIPTLWVLKRIRNRNRYEAFSLFINLLEVCGYSAIVYFSGGLRFPYVLLTYAALISYTGVAAPRRITSLVGAFCVAGFSLVVGLEHAGVLPHQNAVWPYSYRLSDLIMACVIFSGSLAAVAFMATFNGMLLKKNRDKLRRQNDDLVQSRRDQALAAKNLQEKNKMLRARTSELTSINLLAEKTSSSLNMHEVLQAVCNELVKIFDVRNAGIGLLDKEKTKLEIVAFCSSDPDETDVTGLKLPLQEYEAARMVTETKQPVAIDNALTDPTIRPIHSITRESGVILPILSLEEVIGTIALSAQHPNQLFTSAEIELATTIASQVARSVENTRLYTRVEQALDIAEHDLEIGHQIQAGFLPRTMPKVPQWELVPYFVAARQVAGDFFDAFRIGKSDKIGLVVADVCDKGVGAALFMVVFRSLIRALSEDRQYKDNSEEFLLSIVLTINTYIATIHNHSNMFATVFFGVLEPDKNTLYYVNAGHELPLILDAEGNLKKFLDPTGPAIGLMPDLAFSTDKVVMERGDILVAYTDGAVDARNFTGEALSEETFISYFKRPYPSAFSLIKHIESQITAHMSKTDQFDDIAVLAVRRRQTAHDERHEMTQLAKIANLRTLKGFVEQAGVHMDLNEDIIFAFKLAVEEACINIITHGYGGTAPGPIRLTLEKDFKYAKLTIYDEGVSFDPQNAVEPDIASGWEERSMGGLGLFMIREMIDEIDYESSNGLGNYLTLTKTLNLT
jgi:serine phosphatase RsbU (regulator of sigma subunit)/two-component sensor histidine kinase